MKLQVLKNMPPWDWPRDSGDRFYSILRNRSAPEPDRLLAAELAGDFTVINDRLAETLLEILRLSNESDKLRARAVISLGPALDAASLDDFDDPETVPISEQMFHTIQATLEDLYQGTSMPKEVRRRILEAAVRAPQDWHEDAIRSAYASDDRDWKLTAVFSMAYVRGFDEEILESLKSQDPDIHYEAVRAAGSWSIDRAWSHVVELATARNTEKYLLIAAINAVAQIRPEEAGPILEPLTSSSDEDIAEVSSEAIDMAELELRSEVELEEEFDEDLDEDPDEEDDRYF